MAFRWTKGPKQLNEIVVRQPGMRAATRYEAEGIGFKAEANLARHKYEGQAKIEVSSGTVDAFVSLVDPNALSIEFGHNITNAKNGPVLGYVHGLGILRGAIS